MKNKVKLNESQLRNVVAESVKDVLSELDYKTYANAAKKRLQQYRDSNHKDKEKFDKYWELQKAANQSFDDDYVGLMKYDTFGDKMKGKHSPKFDAKIHVANKNMPYSAIQGYNKSGDKLFSTEKGVYHSSKGITTPRNFFRDAEVSDAYTKANDELWDYNNGNYAYDNEKGWHLKESENPAYRKHNMKKRVKLTESDLHRIVKDSINKILKEDYGKGNKYTYKTEDGDTADCEFVTSTFEDGYPYSVGLIDHHKKEVYPCHGYHYPNRCANGLMKKALSLGYTYVDSEMPSEKNKTLLKKQYKNRDIKESVNRILKEGRGRFGDLVDMATEKFNELYIAHKNEVDAHINKVKTSGNFKDLETRLAWDIARATRYMEWMPKDEQGFTVGTDAQLSTLFKQALRNSSIEY